MQTVHGSLRTSFFLILKTKRKKFAMIQALFALSVSFFCKTSVYLCIDQHLQPQTRTKKKLCSIQKTKADTEAPKKLEKTHKICAFTIYCEDFFLELSCIQKTTWSLAKPFSFLEAITIFFFFFSTSSKPSTPLHFGFLRSTPLHSVPGLELVTK